MRIECDNRMYTLVGSVIGCDFGVKTNGRFIAFVLLEDGYGRIIARCLDG